MIVRQLRGFVDTLGCEKKEMVMIGQDALFLSSNFKELCTKIEVLSTHTKDLADEV